MSITLQTDGSNARLDLVCAIDRKRIPFSWLSRSSPRFFRSHRTQHWNCVLYQVHEPAESSACQLAISEYIGNDVWSLSKLDRAVKMKAVRELERFPRDDDLDARNSHDWKLTHFKQTLESSARPSLDRAPAPALELDMACPASTNDPFETIRNAYYDALYVSKVVVYFAKSSLARIKVISAESSAEHSLESVLKSMVLELDQMDEKYARLDTGSALSPHEADFYQRWITNYGDHPELRAKKMSLKMRETMLQVILLLELTALGYIATDDTHSTSPQRPRVRSRRRTLRETVELPPAEEDISTLLDRHFDRLCIYYALKGEKKKADQLVEFCTEVINPFYSLRLPEKTRALHKKAVGYRSSAGAAGEKARRKSTIEDRGPAESAGAIETLVDTDAVADRALSQQYSQPVDYLSQSSQALGQALEEDSWKQPRAKPKPLSSDRQVNVVFKPTPREPQDPVSQPAPITGLSQPPLEISTPHKKRRGSLDLLLVTPKKIFPGNAAAASPSQEENEMVISSEDELIN